MNDSDFFRSFLEIQREQLAELRAIRHALTGEASSPDEACPHCGDTRITDGSTMSGPRRSCLNCGKSWEPAEGVCVG